MFLEKGILHEKGTYLEFLESLFVFKVELVFHDKVSFGEILLLHIHCVYILVMLLILHMNDHINFIPQDSTCKQAKT